jgi:hypothetical protein
VSPTGAAGRLTAEVTEVTTAETGSPAPRPRPPVAPRGADHPAEQADAHPWGRVDEQGVVYVRERAGERQVGEYPDAPAAEALAYFERKYADLAAQVRLLEQRAQSGASPADVARGVERLRETLADASAVGDLDALRDRVAALGGTVEDLTAKQSEEHRAQVDAARAEREAIVAEAEALAARDPATVQWKATGQALDALFARWQEAQRGSVRLPKADQNALWNRFRAARSSIEGQRRAYFAELDATQREAREAKERLVERAEALQGGSGDIIGTYRGLLDEWKRAGRAGRKVDDALWARFRAAGDALYQARAAEHQAQDAEYGENLTAKLALLDEAEPLLSVKDATQARRTLTDIQRRWDAIGRVPREQVRVVEDRLRRIEQAVKSLEQEHWRRTNPETKARSEGLAAQLTSAIDKLEGELAAARATNDTKAIKDAEDALAARRVWLDALSTGR